MTREPLLKKATWVGIATAVLALLVTLGVDIPASTQAAILAVVAAVVPLVAALWGRGDVTPVADPRDADGNQLVPESQDY